MTESEADAQGVLPLENGGEGSDVEPWQTHAVKRMGLSAFTVTVGLLIGAGVENLYRWLDTPLWIVWPLRVVLGVAFVVPVTVAIMGDGWQVIRKQVQRFKGAKR